MRETKQDYVGLFIDWDNLAISIAADLAGAAPDVRRIVEKAQEYGTLVVARAYAEWNTLSERLSVYKAGVEPVYAPTFRFESDAVTQMARGKSLADPVLVADCVETLHLLPYVSVFVIVSGDKDILPVVRLVRLRSKRVVVIGPDYAANVLRELADEFVPYRSLIEAAGAAPAQAPAAPPGRRGAPPPPRRRPAIQPSPPAARPELVRPAEAPPERVEPARPEAPRPEPAARVVEAPPALPVAVRPPRAPVRLPLRERPARPAPWPEAAPPAPPAVPAAAAPAPPAAELEAAPEAPAVPERRAAEAEPPRESVAEVHAAMVDALRQLAAQGKTRVRATNLKDQLLARIPGFSERRYGFSKFKDFLMAAEQAGLITISMLGPVHWVSLPTFAEGAVTPEGERGPLSGRYAEVVRFIAELRQRSRWLTYTYTLNNVVNLLARTLPAEEAEGEARTILNYLVTQGALQIDREPRPVEVGGVTHRVRMCHVNEEHPFFQTLLPAPAGPEEERPAVPAEVGAGEPLAAEGEQPTAPEVAEQPAPSPGEVPESPRRRRPRSRRRRGGREAAGDGAAPSGEGADEEEAPEPVAEAAESVAAAAPTVLSAEAQLAGAPVPAEAAGAAIFELVAADVAQDDGHAVAEATAPPPTVGAAGQPAMEPALEPAMEPALEPAMEPAMEAASLETALAGAAALVREGVSEEQPEVRASTLKQRLVRRLGGFDERRYGFERFRDFLRAAETAGVVRVRDEGRQTWVALPAVEVLEPAAEPPARRRSRRGARGG